MQVAPITTSLKTIAGLSDFESSVYLFCWEPKTITDILKYFYPKTKKPNTHLVLDARKKLEEHGFIRRTTYSLRNASFEAVKERVPDFFIERNKKIPQHKTLYKLMRVYSDLRLSNMRLDNEEQLFLRTYFHSKAAARMMRIPFYTNYAYKYDPAADENTFSLTEKQNNSYHVPDHIEETEEGYVKLTKEVPRQPFFHNRAPEVIWEIFSVPFSISMNPYFIGKDYNASPKASAYKNVLDFDLFLKDRVEEKFKNEKFKTDVNHLLENTIHIATHGVDHYAIMKKDYQFLGIPGSVSYKLSVTMRHISSCAIALF